jgi:putative ABC transport system ATP-binding protein
MDTILKVEKLIKYYGGKGSVTKAVNGVSFEVPAGEFTGIMGASGSGKTTILNCISTIDTVTSGHIFIEGTDITRMKANELSKFRRTKLGFIFQDFNLLDTLTAYENIALALAILKKPAAVIDSRVKEVAGELAITDILQKYPYQMSGGQKQRVAAARAIASKPSLVLADEPTGALDSKSAAALLQSMDTLNSELKATIIMVTHDAFTASYCRRILFIKDGVIFDEIKREGQSRKDFFEQIIGVQTMLGGANSDVL